MISSELHRAGRPGGLSSGYLRILLALVLEVSYHRSLQDVLLYLQK